MPPSPLCGRCAERLADDLAALAELWTDLVDQLARTGQPVTEPVTGTVAHGLVIDERVSDLLATVADWTNFLTRVVVDERGLATYPRHMRVRLRWLAGRHAEWFAHHRDDGLAVAVVDDARDYSRAVRLAVQPGGTRAFAVGPCPNMTTRPAPVGTGDSLAGNRGGGSIPEPVPHKDRGGDMACRQLGTAVLDRPAGVESDDDEPESVPAYPCPGTLYAVLRPNADMLPSKLTCDHDPAHEWSTREWYALGKRLRTGS